MTKEEIQSIIKRSTKVNFTTFRFSLKKRNDILGYFIDVRDSHNLNTKNYWYVLKEDKKEEWLETKNFELLLLFPGEAFSKIQVA